MRSELIVNTRPKSNISENIRTVRTNLEFASASKKLKTILISSSVSGEGKSFISSNLAVAFAQNDKKVLLIDADLRRGRVHNIFNLKNPKGLSNLLLEDDMREIKHYIAKSDIDNLYVLFRGTIPPNPSELLNSDKMHDIFEIAEGTPGVTTDWGELVSANYLTETDVKDKDGYTSAGTTGVRRGTTALPTFTVPQDAAGDYRKLTGK